MIAGNSPVDSSRDISIDILKGIGILFVLVAHSLGGYVYTFAYSFHMPLFFLVSGFFFKKKPLSFIINDFSRLMLPLLFTGTCLLVGSYIMHFLCVEGVKQPDEAWEMLLFANASDANKNKIWGNFACIGSVWFLGALFWCKSLFNLLSRFPKQLLLYSCLAITIVSVIVGQYLILPYSIIQGFTGLSFMWIGMYARSADLLVFKNKYAIILCVILIVLWGITTFFPVLSMASVSWKLFVVPNIILSSSGVFFMYLLSRYIAAHLSLLSKILSFLGRYSILLVCFPVMESYLIPLKSIIPQSALYYPMLYGCKVLWVVFTMYISFKIPVLRKLFQIK